MSKGSHRRTGRQVQWLFKGAIGEERLDQLLHSANTAEQQGEVERMCEPPKEQPLVDENLGGPANIYPTDQQDGGADREHVYPESPPTFLIRVYNYAVRKIKSIYENRSI